MSWNTCLVFFFGNTFGAFMLGTLPFIGQEGQVVYWYNILFLCYSGLFLGTVCDGKIKGMMAWLKREKPSCCCSNQHKGL